MEVKICSNKTCHLVGIQQNIDKFSKNKNKKDGLQYRCKECCKNDQKNASPEQKEKQRARHRIINMTPKQIENTRERHRKENLTPEQIKNNNIRTNRWHKNKSSEKIKEDNKKRIVSNMTDEQLNNKRTSQNKRERRQRQINPISSLRRNISRSVNKMLSIINGGKNGSSILKYLTYSIMELKDHLESLFEPWMTWENRGKYSASIWNDNDQSTWAWNIDHIIPQSILPYISMEDDNFKKVWSLNNLRPYSAKQNILDGTSRIRHTK